MKKTANISLKKPDGSDVINIEDFNYNADLIDKSIVEIINTLKSKVSSSQLQLQLDKIINDAPSGLNTLKKLAQALNNDSNFFNNINSNLTKKVDKIRGKQLSTQDYTTEEKRKLNGIQSNANRYIHPSKHTASAITQDSMHRFVTDSEKSVWNNKIDADHRHEIKDIVVANGKNLSDELKIIPRFSKPNFTFSTKLSPNKVYEISHGLGYKPKLFSYSTTIGNVNPTIQIDEHKIRLYNYVLAPNECYIIIYVW